jgi:hypothetical protein
MSGRASWAASMLLRLACQLMPRERLEWAEAMKSEMAYLPRGAMFSWAAGCFVAALKQRFAPMNTGNFRINRWVFLVETLGCFGPATLAWWEFTFGPSGAAYFGTRMITTGFQGLPPGFQYALGLHAGHAVTGLVAPIGLFLGLRYVMRDRALDNRALGYTLMSAPILQTVAGLIGVIGFGVQPLLPGLFLLLILLPIMGIAHLMYLAKPVVPRPADTGLATG